MADSAHENELEHVVSTANALQESEVFCSKQINFENQTGTCIWGHALKVSRGVSRNVNKLFSVFSSSLNQDQELLLFGKT